MISSAARWQPKITDMMTIADSESSNINRNRNDHVPLRPKILNKCKDLDRPSGLAYDSRNNEIYVSCLGNGQIIVFDRQYKIVRRIQNQDMLAPKCLAFVESLQEIFVTDRWKHTIFVYNRKGQLIRRLCEKGQGDTQLYRPGGIAVLKSQLFIADTGNDRIQILNVDGSYNGEIGPNAKKNVCGKIAGFHDFNEPTDVTVSINAIVVADCGNRKVKVFNHKGHLMFTIGGLGTFKGIFKSPEVVKLDIENNIYVGDADAGKVQIFTPHGTFLRVIEDQKLTMGQLSGLVCLPDNKLLVADSKNNILNLC